MKRISGVDTVNNLEFTGYSGSTLGSDSFSFYDKVSNMTFTLVSRDFSSLLLDPKVEYYNRIVSTKGGFQAACHNFNTFFTKDGDEYKYFLKMTKPNSEKISLNRLQFGNRVKLDYADGTRSDMTFIKKVKVNLSDVDYAIYKDGNVYSTGTLKDAINGTRSKPTKNYFLMYNNNWKCLDMVSSSQKAVERLPELNSVSSDPELLTYKNSIDFLSDITHIKSKYKNSSYSWEDEKSLTILFQGLISYPKDFYTIDFNHSYTNGTPKKEVYKRDRWFHVDCWLRSLLLMKNLVPTKKGYDKGSIYKSRYDLNGMHGKMVADGYKIYFTLKFEDA